MPCGCVLADSRFKKRRFVFEERGTMQHTSLSLWRAFFIQKGSWKRTELAVGTGSHCYRVSNNAELKPHNITTVCFCTLVLVQNQQARYIWLIIPFLHQNERVYGF